MKEISSTIVLRRKPKNGVPGKDGKDAVNVVLTAQTLVFPTSDGKITDGAVARSVTGTIYIGNRSLTTTIRSLMPSSAEGIDITSSFATVTITPIKDADWVRDKTLTIWFSATDGADNYVLPVTVNLSGSAQGQSVSGPPGASITKVEESYLATAEVDEDGNPVPPAADREDWQKEAHINPTAELPYVWNKEVIWITDPVTKVESPVNTDVHLCCTFSDGLTKHESLYLVKDDDTAPDASTSAWGSLEDAMAQFSSAHRYLWNKETVEYKDTSLNRTNIRLLAVWGQDAPSISLGVTSSPSETGKEYLSINGAKQTKCTFYQYYLDADGVVQRTTAQGNYAIQFLRGTHLFFIDSNTMNLQEHDYADTYSESKLCNGLAGVIDWYIKNRPNTIIVLMTSDAAACTNNLRQALARCGGLKEGVYSNSTGAMGVRRRHYFIGQCSDIAAEQGYEEISEDTTLKEVTVQIQKGIGIVKNGTQGTDGVTPHIGENGNWWFGDTDTGTKATPEDPDVWTIGDDGYWYLNGVKTEKKATGEDGKDGEDGANGQSVIVSYAFRRSATTLKPTDVPRGGTYASPHPVSVLSPNWSDGIPEGSDPIYMSSRIFTSDNKPPQQGAWQPPCLMVDTADIDVEYSDVETNPGDPTRNPTNWHNDATSNDIWMAVRSKTGGTWSGWQVTKIKGERGADGANGKDAVNLVLTTNTLVFPTSDGKVTEGAVVRTVTGTLYLGNSPMQTIISKHTLSGDNGSVVCTYSGATATVTPVPDQTWGNDKVLSLEFNATNNGTTYTLNADITISGSAQGQSVKGPQGASITKVEESYLATAEVDASGNPVPPDADREDWQEGSHINPTPELPYVWNKEVVYVKAPEDAQPYPVNTDVHLCCTFSDGLTKHESLYLVKDDATAPDESSSDWGPLATAMAQFSPAHRYLWNKEVVEYKDTRLNRTNIRLLAVWGQDGRNITNVANFYAWTYNGTDSPSAYEWGAPDTIPAHEKGKNYLWNYEVAKDAEGNIISQTDAVCIGYYPTDGVSFDSITEYYHLSSDGTTPPTLPTLNPGQTAISKLNGWATNILSPTDTERYLWNIELIRTTDGFVRLSTAHVAGVYGKDGKDGEPGQNGADGFGAPQPNLFGYGCALRDGNNSYMRVHTKNGFVAFGKSATPNSNNHMAVLIDIPDIVSGKEYYITGNIELPVSGAKFRMGLKGVQTTDTNAGDFNFRITAGSTDECLRFQMQAPKKVWCGYMRVSNLKVEEIAEGQTKATAFMGLAEDTTPQGPNLIPGTSFENLAKWETKAGSIVHNAKDGVRAYQGSNSSGNKKILEMNIKDILKTNTIYTLSYWAKASSSGSGKYRSYVFPDISGKDGFTVNDYGTTSYPWTQSLHTWTSGGKGVANALSILHVHIEKGRSIKIHINGSSETNDYLYLSSTPNYYTSSYLKRWSGKKIDGTNIDEDYTLVCDDYTEAGADYYLIYKKDGTVNTEDDQYIVTFPYSLYFNLHDTDRVWRYIDNRHEIEPSSDFRFHSVTFRTGNTLTADAYYLLFRIDEGSGELTICQPKLEEGDHPTRWQVSEADRVGAVARPCGEWKSNATYVWDAAYRDIVTYKYQDAEKNQQEEFFAIVKPGINATNKPPMIPRVDNPDIPVVNSNYWERANQFDFVATDLLLSDKIYAKVLSAVQARIDQLIVERLQTTGNGATIEMQEGLMRVFGANGISPNIEFGIDDAGYAVLKYYDNGQLLYNLGPQGIMSQVQETNNRFSNGRKYKFVCSELGTLELKWTDITRDKTFYIFTEGYKKVGTLLYYKIALNAPTTQGADYTKPYQYNNCLFKTNNLKSYYNYYDGTSERRVFDSTNGKPYAEDLVLEAYYIIGEKTAEMAEYYKCTVALLGPNVANQDTFTLYLYKSGNEYFLCDNNYRRITTDEPTVAQYKQLTGQAQQSRMLRLLEY